MRTRTGTLLGVLLAAALLAPAATGAGEVQEGDSWVVAVDLSAGTIELENGHTYDVTPETRLLDAAGHRIPLSAVPVAPGSGGLRALTPEVGAHYVADARGRLHSLQVGVPVRE